jgi:hypothetical protein
VKNGAKDRKMPATAGLRGAFAVARALAQWLPIPIIALLAALSCGNAVSAQTPAPVNLQAPLSFNGSVGTVPNAVAMGDFSGDGLQFFAVIETNPSNPRASQIEVFFGTEMGSFISKGVILNIGVIGGQQFSATHPIAVGHFNGASQPLGIAVAVNSSSVPGCAQGGVVVLFGNADQTFQSPVCLPDSPGVNGVVVGDFLGTGFDDIAAANASGAGTSFTVFQSSGASSFPASASFSSVAPGTSTVLNGLLYVGGYGNTNLPNLVLLASTGPFTQFVAALQPTHVSGSSALAFMNSGVLATGSNGFTDIGFADMNGDGVADIVGISEDTNLQYFPVTVTPVEGVNVIHALTGIGGPDGFALSVGDFNGNGIGDFASLNENRNLSITFDVPCFNTLNTLCQTTPAIKPLTIGPFGPSAQGIASGFSKALSGSGDWVVVDTGVLQATNSSSQEIPEARSIVVYLINQATGQITLAPFFSQPSTITTGTPPPAFAVADLDGDGAPDVAVLGEDEANFAATVTPFQNVFKTASGSGPAFIAQPVVDLGAGQEISEPGLNPFAIAAGKFRNAANNPSGLPDLALVLPDGITVLNNGGGFTFGVDAKCQGVLTSPATNCYLNSDPNFPGFPFSSPPRPAIIAADVNGDGIDDIILAVPENCNANGAPEARIYVLISNGDGSFQPAISYPSPVVNPVALAVGNILGPGSPDLLVTNGGEVCSGGEAAAGAITKVGATLLPNRRDGSGFGSPATAIPQTFFAQSSDLLLPDVSSVAVADMNADGTPDVVLSANDGIHVLLNNKTNPGTFTDKGAVPLYGPGDIISNAAQIDIADFNGDGKPDVAAAIGGVAYVFPNDGTGVLTSPSQGFASGPNSGQVKAIDVKGEGVTDILVSNSLGFSVVLNNLAAVPALSVSTPPLAGGTVGTPYSQTLAASGGTKPYTWSIPPGTLPPGLSLSASGGITGTPTAAGTFDFTVTVADSSAPARSATAPLSIQIAAAAPPIVITIAPLHPTVAVGQTLQFTAAVTGSASPALSWTVQPTGCGSITPTAGLYTAPGTVPAGSCSVTAASIAPVGGTASVTLTVTAAAAPPPITIPTISEMITVTDNPTLTDVADTEKITVTDTVTVTSATPVIRVGPAATNPSAITTGTDSYVVNVTLTNGGNVAIGELTLLKASLGGLGALTFPAGTTLGNLAPGASATFTARFSNSAGAAGKGVPLSLSGTYATGTLSGNWSVSFRSVTLP